MFSESKLNKKKNIEAEERFQKITKETNGKANYREWQSRSQSCPLCRDSLKRVNSGDLWVFIDSKDIVDMTTVTRENLRRLFPYIDKLPLIIPDSLFDTYDSHLR